MAGGGGGAKADEPAPHPPKDQLPNVSYCITSPPPWPLYSNAWYNGSHSYGSSSSNGRWQYKISEEKAKVIQTLLFVAGINTLLQSLFGTRLPAVIRGSYTFVAPTISLILSGRWSHPDPIVRFKKTMRTIQGAIIIISTLQIVLGLAVSGEISRGNFGAVFASISAPIVAALYCLFFAYVGSAGLSYLQFCNLNSFRTKFILGFSFFLGLSVPRYFKEYEAINGYGPVHTSARWFNNMVNAPFLSEAFVGGILAYCF